MSEIPPPDPRQRDMPDFRNWPTARLQFVLHEYEEQIPAVRATHGRSRHAEEERALYRKWIEAIEAELARRGAAS